MTINIQNNMFVGGDVGSVINSTSPQQLAQVGEILAITGIAALLASQFMQRGGGAQPSPVANPPFMPIAPPPPPQGMTTGANGLVSFPDGTTIQQTGQYNWSVHNADGTTETITGDPHVTDAKGNKWDFQQNAEFTLKNGAHIFVNTTPYGSGGARVTQSLDVTYGNQHTTVSGIDQGKAAAGPITNDGYSYAGAHQGEPNFVEDTQDTWTMNGKEIIGGSTLTGLKLGQNMQTLTNGPGQYGQQWSQVIMATIETAFLALIASQIAQSLGQGQYQNYQSPQPQVQTANPALQNIGRGVYDVGRMVKALQDYAALTAGTNQRVLA